MNTLGYFFGNFRKTYGYIGRRFHLLVAAIVAGGLFESVGIGAFLPILNLGEPAEDRISKAFHEFFEFIGVAPTLVSLLILLVVVFLAKGVAILVQDVVILRVHTGLMFQLRIMMVEKYGAMALSLYSDSTTGYLNNIVTTEIERMIAAIMRFIRMMVNATYVLIYILMSAVLNLQLTLFMVICGVAMVMAAKPLVRLSRRYSISISEENASLQNALIEFIQNFVYIKATHAFPRFFEHIKSNVERLRHLNFRVRLIGAAMTSSLEPVGVLLVAGLLYYQVAVQNKGVAEFLILAMFFYRTFTKLLELQIFWQKFNENLGGLSTFEQAKHRLDAHREISGTQVPRPGDTGIEFKNVSFAYKDQAALKDISLSIPANATIAIVGESGAGKTTTFGLLTGMLSPSQGQILIGEIDYRNLDLAELRRRIGYVTQDPVIFHASVADNISMWACESGDPDAMNRVKKAAEMAHCAEFIARTSNGYDTIVGERGIKLSGGQRQRIAIARELYKEPEIMIFDEATSSLDTESERLIQASISEMKGERTVIVIAHRLSTIRNADYIYVLSRGRLIEAGTFDELRSAQQGSFQRMYASQQL